MATISIGKIVLYEPLDQAKITALLAGPDTIVFEVQRAFKLQDYPDVLTAVLPTQFTGVVDYIDALKDVIDISNWLHLENAIIWKVVYNETLKEFDLTNSYVRDSKDTSGALTALTTGQLLRAKFTTPGLDTVTITEIDLPYNQAISAGDIALLTAVGIVLETFSTGDFITVKNQTVPYKVEFYRPISVTTVNYIIDFNFTQQTINI